MHDPELDPQSEIEIGIEEVIRIINEIVKPLY